MAKKPTQSEINEGLLIEIYNLCHSNKQNNKIANMVCKRIDDTKPAKQKKAEELERLFDQHLLQASKPSTL